MNSDIERTARALVADGKGILAADETPGTLTKRFDALGIPSTEQSRRAYREMLFTAPDAATFISGVIMQDETIRQKSATDSRFPRCSRAGASLPASRSMRARSRSRLPRAR